MRTLILFVLLGISVFFNFEQFHENSRVRSLAYNCKTAIAETQENIRQALFLIEQQAKIYGPTARVEKMLKGRVPKREVNRYARAFLASSIKHKIPVRLLISIASAESNFDPNIISKKGAVGVMQVMPFWVKEMTELSSVYDLFNIEKNIDAGADVLAQYRKRFGHIKTTITAYNRGETKVARYLAVGMDPSNVYTTKVLTRWGQTRKNYL